MRGGLCLGRIRKDIVRLIVGLPSGGHRTSIQLEATFWGLLDEIAQGTGERHTANSCRRFTTKCLHSDGQVPNFASTPRTTCALYLRVRRPLKQ